MRWLAMMVLIGCGRIDFDPVDDARRDAAGNTDGSTGGDGDAAATACASAMTLPVATPITIDTCATGMDLIDGCGPPGTQEVVFAFTAPTSGGYNFRARDPGTNNVSTSTGVVDAACTGTLTCAGILGRSLAAGETIYFALEASSGGCFTVEFENF